jgi:hypothetical protein
MATIAVHREVKASFAQAFKALNARADVSGYLQSAAHVPAEPGLLDLVFVVPTSLVARIDEALAPFVQAASQYREFGGPFKTGEA